MRKNNSAVVNRRTLLGEVLRRLRLSIGEPITGLLYSSNFELLIAVMLSARTTDEIVNRVTQRLFTIADTPEAIVALGTERLEQYIRSSGFYRSKAHHIIATCQILIEKFDGNVPRERKYLEQLPGVGRKTANVVLNVAFNMPTLAVDTHVFRVAKRLALAQGKTPEKVELELLGILPKEFNKNAGMLLLLHGRRVCVARKPHCNLCSLKEFCDFYSMNKIVKKRSNI
jgi:endonuclease-3